MKLYCRAGDVVKLRKVHPCGGDKWRVLRIGVDFRIKCITCGRILMLPRDQFEKKVKLVLTSAESSEEVASEE